MTKAVETLVNRSLECYQGMIVRRDAPRVEEYPLDIAELLPKFNGTFCVNNSTAAFVLDGKVYVVPYTQTVGKILDENFKREYFFVPFSNWDYPKNELQVWKKLLYGADQERKLEFEEDCQDLCKKDISVLPEDVMKETILIPLEGFMVERLGVVERVSPITRYGVLDCTTAEFLGNYACNNGVVTFVTPRGKQYIGRGYGLIKTLQEYGYVEKQFYVPMSNGEHFQSSYIQNEWENLKRFVS